MAQFNYWNEINTVVNMDGELTRCPAPRWQKKMDSSTTTLNGSINTSKLSISYNNGMTSFAASISGNKTPQHGNSGGKSPNRQQKTPNNGSKTPSGGDRFIPNRGASNFDLGHLKIKMDQLQINDNNNENVNGNIQTDHQKFLTESLHGGDINARKIFAYREKAPAPPEFHTNPLKVVYSVKTPMSTKSGSRYIPNSPERILDAPDIINDYYLNLMDWSKANIVAVALGEVVYLWNAATGSTDQLREYDSGDHACSLSWIQEGHILAIGNNEGTVELWDCQKKKRLRVMDGHSARVGALAWNTYIISSGSRDGSIIHHDVREREHNVQTLVGHTQEVCGLKWSTDFKYLASGGNDNLVNIWPTICGSNKANIQTNLTAPLYAFNQHQAAVRALAWCPWQPNILATGGGTADRCIKFWNVYSGTMINSIDSQSQVCALLWSKTYKELISAHGYAKNQLTIWKYPSMIKQAELVGHKSRVLQIAMSPDGSTVMSAAADETLRLWNCFAPDPYQRKKGTIPVSAKPSILKQSIR